MEKDPGGNPRSAGCYRAYEGLKPANNGNTSSLKRSGPVAAAMPGMDHASATSGSQDSQVRCLCFGEVQDKAGGYPFIKRFLKNIAICAVLVLYTMLGSFIFLYVEGTAELPQQRILTPASPGGSAHLNTRRNATWLNQINEARAHTVENLWVTTEKLNILYHENWTRLASEEIARFQEHVVRTLTDNLVASQNSVTHTGSEDVTGKKIVNYEWNFTRAFLYSLTVLTTIGYGSITPRSTLGKLVTMGYAFVGIPLTLIYLSAAGGLLSRCARGVFTRALCCCLCSNCGYCCYDERRMQVSEKERRMRKRRQQEELAQQQQQQQLQLQEPFYVRANASTYPSSVEIKSSPKDEVSSLGSGDRPNVTILAPISISIGSLFCYISAGAFTLHKLEGWSFIDASYFCFMCLTTVGFDYAVPGSYPNYNALEMRNASLWFCSIYIMFGMALTAMCFNILQDEIVHRFFHEPEEPEPVKASPSTDELSGDPFAMTS